MGSSRRLPRRTSHAPTSTGIGIESCSRRRSGRMHDKTQVFPLPVNDFVHSRLTHSLEAASVGRSLGNYVARRLASSDEYVREHISEIAAVVSAACLAHDIGNPPFGHAGEAAIATFFREEGREYLARLTPREKCDLQEFEGNAQGFRMLARLQQEATGGLKLTAACLSAFSKYPRESGKDLFLDGDACTGKHGVLQADLALFRSVAAATGLVVHAPAGDRHAWRRHPLSFLVEAADNICYSILDLEDGVKLKYVSQEQAAEHLRFAKSSISASGAHVSHMRALAIGKLVRECAEEFLSNVDALLAGTHKRALTDTIPSASAVEAVQDFTRKQCYRAVDVLEIELAGYKAIGGLLELFTAAVVSEKSTRTKRQKTALELLRAQEVIVDDCAPTYERILRVTDYISGMTDRYALGTYRKITGSALPGRVA